jgi:hypothetical protein
MSALVTLAFVAACVEEPSRPTAGGSSSSGAMDVRALASSAPVPKDDTET